jgi:DNA primase
MKTNTKPKRVRPPWDEIKDRIDLAEVATGLLGPAPKRSGRRLLWHCPFHDDRNPSFEVDPQTQRWKCWPCDKGGDAASLLMAVEGIGFPEAVGRLAVRSGWVAKASPLAHHAPRPPASKGFSLAEAPGGLSAAEALALVEESERRLWTPEGEPALGYLTAERGLTEATIRRHRLGWTPREMLPTSRGDRFYRVTGIVIPWFDGGRLSLVKIRQPDGARPRYAEAFRDRPTAYADVASIRPGSALIVVEGEFEAMLLRQELGSLASVATFGGSSGRSDDRTRIAASLCPLRFAAHDADDAGESAAAAWSREPSGSARQPARTGPRR